LAVAFFAGAFVVSPVVAAELAAEAAAFAAGAVFFADFLVGLADFAADVVGVPASVTGPSSGGIVMGFTFSRFVAGGHR
jgi:hypothetical protein